MLCFTCSACIDQRLRTTARAERAPGWEGFLLLEQGRANLPRLGYMVIVKMFFESTWDFIFCSSCGRSRRLWENGLNVVLLFCLRPAIHSCHLFLINGEVFDGFQHGGVVGGDEEISERTQWTPIRHTVPGIYIVAGCRLASEQRTSTYSIESIQISANLWPMVV